MKEEVVKKVVYSDVPVIRRPYTASGRDFQAWLDCKVWVSGNEKATRREYIPVFADALTSWMRSMGYTMDGRWAKGHRVVAQWLYAIQIMEIARCDYDAPLTYPQLLHRDWPEDRDVFNMYVNYASVNDFLDSWKNIEDLDYEFRWGRRVYEELEKLLYHHIDLDASRQGIKLANILIGSDSDSESEGGRRRGKDDVYLQEAREGLHGGRGSKV